jgi:error-prone DNA polymerase
VRPVDVGVSNWDCALEADCAYEPASMTDGPEDWGKSWPAIRLGMRVVKGFSEETAKAIEAARQHGSFKSVPDFARRVSAHAKPRRGDLHKLAAADAFRSMGLDRRQALWEVRGYEKPVPDLFRDLDPAEPAAPLPGISEQEHVTADYHATNLSLRAHPVSFYRDELRRQGIVTTASLRDRKHGDRVEVAGTIISYQRPGTAGGITFVTLEDETDVANLVVYKDFMEANRKVLLGSRYLVVSGKVEKQGDVIHVKVEGVRSLDEELPDIQTKARKFR